MKNKLKRFCTAVLLLFVLITACPSCSSNPPELETVKDEFVSLIEASREVNDIFFGEGLDVYDRDSSYTEENATYDEEHKVYYWIIELEDGVVVKYFDNETKEYVFVERDGKRDGESEVYSKGEYYYYASDYTESESEFIYSDDDPQNYDYVRFDCKYKSLDQIKELAESVYSREYLFGKDYKEGDMGYGGIYSVIFDGVAAGSEIIYARYIESSKEGSLFLMKSNKSEPFFETQTEYDYSTMKIVMPSSETLVNVEIMANGRYIDYEAGEQVNGEHKVTLTFVKQGNAWRLDTPTY